MSTWHLIKVECTDLATPAGLAHLVQYIQSAPFTPFLLLSHDVDVPPPGDSARDETAAMVNFSLNRNTSNYSIQSSNIIKYTEDSKVDWARTSRCLEGLLPELPADAVPIMTAARCTDPEGVSGEFEAAVLSRLLGAKKLTFLTSAGGILSANPDYAQEAFIVPYLSLQEAAELAYLNSGLLQPASLAPLLNVPLTIAVHDVKRSEATGTTISSESPETEQLAKGITAQSDLSLLVIDGLGMVGIPGITARAFKALASESINIVLLSQASTEQSIGIVVAQNKQADALKLLEAAFADRMAAGEISRIYALDFVGIVTVVDERMRYKSGLTGKMFSTLGRSGINVLTIADGASESNLSAVVAGRDLPAAVDALHEAFCRGRRVAHVFMFGTGTIGGQLLTLMQQQANYWLQELNLKIRLVGLSNSRHMVLHKTGIAFNEALTELEKSDRPRDVDAIMHHLINSRLDRLIVIDATASEEIAAIYPGLLEHNIAVVTPNKRANTGSVASYERLHAAARDHQVPYFYETTVGAGLPILSTLRDLIRSGDEILKIEGVVSGTLSYLFNSLGDGLSFADALQRAYELGYTEPDPRDDLSGEDVARKMLILAREAGLMIEREAITITPLLDEALMQMPRVQFLEEFKARLAGWSPRISLNPGQKVHYVGKIEGGAIQVGLQAIDRDAAFATLHGTDNMIVFTTRRYLETPLIVRGPGAGPAVTAGGVLADLIRAAELVT